MTHSCSLSAADRSALAAGLCLAISFAALVDVARGQTNSPDVAAPAGAYSSLAPSSRTPYPATTTPSAANSWPAFGVQQASAASGAGRDVLPTSASWIVPAGDYEPEQYVDADVYCEGDPYPGPTLFNPPGSDAWGWQVLPDGLIYRSYWAGVHEPRVGIVFLKETGVGQSFWDAALGGRVGLIRFGNGDPLHPQGWQIDFEGAALPRLTLDNVRDLETVDFRAGTFLTYGVHNWQFKFGYDHLSSHLGDEFAIANPGSLANRINYVRDTLVLGVSNYPIPEMRLYAETGFAVNSDGGAEPLEFQFGTELSRPGPTGFAGTPFLALNGHLREESNFSGDFTAQSGWLWRGMTGQTMRIGAHYFNGKSSQYQTFNDSEQQIGLGLWYDY